MSTPGGNTRRGFRLRTDGAALFPAVGIVTGVALLSVTVVLSLQGSSSGSNSSGIVTANSAADPAAVPAANSCTLFLDGAHRTLTLSQARTLTQVAAVGWQVKAPEDMVARVLDIAAATPSKSPSVTDALDLFTREDSTAPTAGALENLRALSAPGALTCTFAAPTVGVEKKGSSGLTPRADAMRQGVVDAFGKLAMTGYGAKSKPETGAQAAGRALAVQVPAAFTPGDGRGWVIAHWLTARAADYKLDAIAFGERTWTPSLGWQAAVPGTPEAAQARADRVYVAVTQGAAAAKATPAKDSKKDKKSDKKSSKNKKKSSKTKSGKKKS